MRNISNRFNRSAEHCLDVASRKGFLGFAFMSGVAALPFSYTASAALMASPVIYAGFGYAQKGIAKALEYLQPSQN